MPVLIIIFEILQLFSKTLRGLAAECLSETLTAHEAAGPLWSLTSFLSAVEQSRTKTSDDAAFSHAVMLQNSWDSHAENTKGAEALDVFKHTKKPFSHSLSTSEPRDPEKNEAWKKICKTYVFLCVQHLNAKWKKERAVRLKPKKIKNLSDHCSKQNALMNSLLNHKADFLSYWPDESRLILHFGLSSLHVIWCRYQLAFLAA